MPAFAFAPFQVSTRQRERLGRFVVPKWATVPWSRHDTQRNHQHQRTLRLFRLNAYRLDVTRVRVRPLTRARWTKSHHSVCIRRQPLPTGRRNLAESARTARRDQLVFADAGENEQVHIASCSPRPQSSGEPVWGLGCSSRANASLHCVPLVFQHQGELSPSQKAVR